MNSDDRDCCVILVTAASQARAKNIAAALVEAKLAACVAITPIESIYTWEGKVNTDSEWQLTIKTRSSLFSLVSVKVKSLHSYEVPEIIALPIIAGSQSYLDWIAANVKQD